MSEETPSTDLLTKIKQLALERDQGDERLLAGIVEMEALLKELKLGVILTTKVPFEGTLIYKKEGNRWRLFLDNSEVSHCETVVPLINGSRKTRIAAMCCFPALIAGAVDTLTSVLRQQNFAVARVQEAKDLLNAFSDAER